LIYGPTNHSLPHALTASINSTPPLNPQIIPKQLNTLIGNLPCKMNMMLFFAITHADGSIERHKACLVAKGFNLKEGLDYDKTFSLVVKPATIGCSKCFLKWFLTRRGVHEATNCCRMGNLSFFLGMEIHRTSETIYLSQIRYSCKPSPTSMASATNLSSLDGDPLPDATTYRSVVGGLQYFTLSRPEIAFAVNQAVKCIYCYIKRTLEHSLKFHKACDYLLRGYANADWAGSVDDRRSTMALVFLLAPIYSPIPQRNNSLSPVLVLKPNIGLLPPPLLNFVGSTTYFVNSRSHFALLCVSPCG
ncbi:transposable element gene, partial [Prunus dulcis]